MTKIVDNYQPFKGLNLSNTRSENETYEQYKGRLRQNKEILKTYKLYGRDIFKDMFPEGVAEALKSNPKKEAEKVNTEELGEAK